MIDYNPGKWQVSFVLSCRGSAFPKALCWAIPSAAFSYCLHHLMERNLTMSVSQMASFNFILGFLVVFRTQHAYSRYWEGATIIQKVRGEWFNAISSCIAFCSSDPDPAMQEEVIAFQHLLIRLASLLFCCSLQQISVLEDEAFDVINLDGISEDSLQYLAGSPEKSLVVLNWIQRLIFQCLENGIITAPAPVASRIFQELSNGIVSIVEAQKITDVIFPFPYAQTVSVLLMIYSVFTPVVMATIMEDINWCSAVTFLSVLVFWTINYISSEIEMPFGDDPNDLPVARLAESMNVALATMMCPKARTPPLFNYNKKEHEDCQSSPCPFYLITDVQHHMFAEKHMKAKRTSAKDHDAFKS